MLIGNHGKTLHLCIVDNTSNPRIIVIPRSWRRVYAPAVREYAPYLIESRVTPEKYIDVLAPIHTKREACGGLQPSSISPFENACREATSLCIEPPKPQGYFKLFCAHDRPYYMQCNMCRRDKGEASENWEKLTAGLL